MTPLSARAVAKTFVQRRRTQNRNSQRMYRLRRLEERSEILARATTAEETSRNMKVKVEYLEKRLEELTSKCDRFQAENLALRTCTGSIPGRISRRDLDTWTGRV